MLPIHVLTASQKIELEEIYRSSSKAHFRDRCQCILLVDGGLRVKAAASIYKVRTRSVYTWYHNYMKEGLLALNIQEGRGVKAILDSVNAETVEIIKSEVALHPQNIKGVVASLCDKINMEITVHQLKRFLKKKLKFSFRRLRKSLKTKQDPEEYVRLEAQLENLLFLENESYIDVYFGDESGFDLDPSIPYGWQPVGIYKGIVPQSSKRRNVFGLLSTKNHFVGYDVVGSINSDLVIEFINDFVKEIKQKTVIVLDNATIHKSKAFQKKKKEWEEQDLYIWYLPTYSPHLNRIETLWRKIKYEWLRPNDYLNWQTLNNAIDEILANIGKKYVIAFA